MSGSSGPNGRATLGGIVVVAVLLVLGIWIFKVLDDSQTAQTCLESGRRDCSRIDVPAAR